MYNVKIIKFNLSLFHYLKLMKISFIKERDFLEKYMYIYFL